MEDTQTLFVLGHKIKPVDVAGNYDFVIGETPAGVPGPPPHHHEALCELFMVTGGEMEFVVDGDVRIVKAGDTVNLPPRAVHTFRNVSDAACSWINVHSPKGFWSFFSDMGVSVRDTNAFEKSVDPVLIEKVMATAADYDMIIANDGP